MTNSQRDAAALIAADRLILIAQAQHPAGVVARAYLAVARTLIADRRRLVAAVAARGGVTALQLSIMPEYRQLVTDTQVGMRNVATVAAAETANLVTAARTRAVDTLTAIEITPTPPVQSQPFGWEDRLTARADEATQRITGAADSLVEDAADDFGADEITAAMEPAVTGALMTLRTAQMYGYRGTLTDAFGADPAIGSWRWVAVPGCCAFCAGRDGTVHPASETLDSHPNCRCVPVPIEATGAGDATLDGS